MGLWIEDAMSQMRPPEARIWPRETAGAAAQLGISPQPERLMGRPVSSRTGIRFLGNGSISHMEVHDLTNENRNCQVDEILAAGNGVGFRPDTLGQAHSEGYENCAYCIGGSTR